MRVIAVCFVPRSRGAQNRPADLFSLPLKGLARLEKPATSYITTGKRGCGGNGQRGQGTLGGTLGESASVKGTTVVASPLRICCPLVNV